MSQFEESRRRSREPSQWIRDLTSAAKGVEAIVFQDVTEAVRHADRIAERKMRAQDAAAHDSTRARPAAGSRGRRA